MLQNQDGIAKESIDQFAWRRSASSATGCPRLPAAEAAEPYELPPEKRERVAPQTLEVSGLTVRYGGVIAVDDVSFTVVPGTDHRADRPERRRQDDGDRRRHRVHPRRTGTCTLDGQRHQRAVGRHAGPEPA